MSLLLLLQLRGAARGIGSASTDDEVMHAGPPALSPVEYRFYTEFQSHEAEFDYLKSLEIEEKISQIAWCKRSGPALFLLSTNDKTIKLWKVHEKRTTAVSGMNVEAGRYGAVPPVTSLRMPTISHGEKQVVATPRRIFSNAHAYHINSIDANSDGQTFLSADDLRVNLWSFENASLSFNVVDLKPPTLEELTEVITSAQFHPTHCNLFMYSSSRGSVRLADMRSSALCDKQAKCKSFYLRCPTCLRRHS
jgi:serine/threonine-protein phosphatase 2A regulatory subunit B